MKILGYDEVDWQQALELNLIGFDWYLTPDLVKNILKADKRVPKGFAIYAVEKGSVLGQVGVLVDKIQTTNGEEKLGYLWCIVTRPNEVKKGVATLLIEEAHARLKAENARYSFLGTQKSLIAHNLFRKLGYFDLISYNTGFKACSEIKSGSREVDFNPICDEKMIAAIFSQYSQNLLGFVHRPKNFVSIRKAWGWMPLDLIGLFLKNNNMAGYVLGINEGGIVKIRELCCPNSQDISGCISALERELKPKHILFHFISRKSIICCLENRGFRFINPTYSTYMIKDLKEKQKISDIQRSFGIESNKFQMTSIDYY
jgi:GNAT superfamily N-acetyltransferase